MKLLTWNACRLLARNREWALINILTSTGADVATITECKIPEGSREFSVAGYTTFSPTPSLQGGKTRVLILVKNDLAVRANVMVISDIMDPAVQSVWLHFSHHRICSGRATLGAFILGGIYREWTPLLSREESRLRLGSLLHQISKAADGSQVFINGDFNIDLDRVDDGNARQAPRRVQRKQRCRLSGRTATLSPNRRETFHVRPETSQVLQEVSQVPQEVCQVRQEEDKVRQEICQVRQEMDKVRQATFISTLG
jgi:exonuclease III